MRTVKACAYLVATLFGHLCVANGIALAQGAPSSDALDQMILQLNKEDARVTASVVRSDDFGGLTAEMNYNVGSRTDDICDMQHFKLKLTNDQTRKSNSYAVLLDRQSNKSKIEPRQLLALTAVLHVDADGSSRAYHPEDPFGKGDCQFSQNAEGYSVRGVCALDTLSNGGIKVFSGTRRLVGSEFEREWRRLWPLIRDQKIVSSVVSAISKVKANAQYYLFHSNDQNLTAFFKKDIVPATAAGYPCTYGSNSPFPGYFVAATTLVHANDVAPPAGHSPSDIAPSECRPLRFINAEHVPFFVLPGGRIGKAKVGDIVVAYAKIGSSERLVYGVVADAGPTDSFGEGSIALIQELLGKSGEPVMNNAKLNALDISKETKITVAILILGGTKELLNGNYTRKNIEAVGRDEFARWGKKTVSPETRLRSCIAQAKTNPQ